MSAALLLLAHSAQAATIPVNTTTDLVTTDGNCSLREAIQAANADSVVDACPAGSGADTISLPPGLYTLTVIGAGEDANATGDLDATDPAGLTMTGAGVSTTFINANGIDRAIHAVAGPVTLANLTVQNGSVSGDGGGVYGNSDVAITGAQFTSNTATFRGGAVYVAGVLDITNTTFVLNSGSDRGGALYNASGSLSTLVNAQFLSNTLPGGEGGGAMFLGPAVVNGGLFLNNHSTGGGLPDGGGLVVGGDLTLTGTQFINNSAASSAGGLKVNGTAILTNAVFISNTSNGHGGGLYAIGPLTLDHALVYSNTGGLGGGVYGLNGATILGGIFQNNTAPNFGGGLQIAGGVLALTDTQFIHNTGGVGGGLSYYNTTGGARIVNALFAQNYATSKGNGIYIQYGSNAHIIHTTIASPTLASGAGIYIDTGAADVGITNTIIANQATGIQQVDGAVSEDYNLFFGNTANLTGVITSGGNSLTGNPQFYAPCANAYRLGPSSAAIDAGTNAGVTSDFEGDSRPLLGGFDIGFDEATTASGDVPISCLAAANSSPVIFGNAVSFTATIGGGTSVSYQWAFGDGATGSGATLSHSYATAGSYTAIVTATNGLGSVTATTLVTVTNPPPTATPTSTPTATPTRTPTRTPTATTTPTNVPSSTPTRTPTATTTPTSGPSSTPTSTSTSVSSSTPTPTSTSGPSSTPTPTSTSGPSSTPTPTSTSVPSSTPTPISTSGPSATPVDTATPTGDAPIGGLQATNDGPTDIGNITNFAATVLTGTNVLYQWNFGDGTTGLGAVTSHLYNVPGTYTAIVTATNTANAAVESTTVSIVVLGAINCQQSALNAAISNGGSGTVTLDGNCIYQINTAVATLGSGPTAENIGVFLNNALVVEGNGAIIELAAGAPDMHLLYVEKSGIVIRNLTVRGGRTPGNGGGLYIRSSATLSNVTVMSNTALNSGGGLIAFNSLTVINSTFKNNQSTSAKSGGAIYFQPGTSSGLLSIEGSTFSGNRGESFGGAVSIGVTATVSITNSVFADNTSSRGTALYTNKSGVSLNVSHSTFANQGPLVNPSPAIYVWGSLNLRNSIIANHAFGIAAAGGSGVSDSENYNLFSNVTSKSQLFNLGTSIINGANSKVVIDAKFVDEKTGNFRLQSTSPAIDAGTNIAVTTDADGRVRPYVGTQPDMGAYEYPGGSLPSLAIVKASQPFPWVAANQPIVYQVRVINQSAVTATNLVVSDRLPLGATYKANSATDGGTFNNGTLTWNLASLGPNQSKSLSYIVTPTQALVNNAYSVSSTTNSAIIATGTVFTTPIKSITATLNISGTYFSPVVDGFGYANYADTITNTQGISDDLTIAAMIKLFGANVACKTQNPCVLSSVVEQWRQATMALMTGGHCYGFAMLSLDIFARAPTPSEFQPGIAKTVDLQKEPLRPNIGLYWTLQRTNPTLPGGLQPTPGVTTAVGVLNFLSTNLSNSSPTLDRYVLSIRKFDGNGGHAITPYAIEQIDSNVAWIYVYDNNYPNDFNRVVKVNRPTNSWVYEGAQINPSAPTATYTGTASSGTIGLRSLNYNNQYAKTFVTPTVATARALGVGQSSNTMQFAVPGEAYLLITRSDGKRVGQNPTTGEFINEIPGAEFTFLDTGSELNTPPLVQLDHVTGMTYRIQLFNRRSALGGDEATVGLSISGAGYAIAMNGLVLNSPQLLAGGNTSAAQAAQYDGVALSFAPDSKRLTFQTSTLDEQTPQLVMAISQNNGADYTVALNSVNLDKGESVALSFNNLTGQITLENNSSQNNRYSLQVERLNTNGTTDVFNSSTLRDGAGVGAIINVGSTWNGTSAPMVTTNTTVTLPPAWLMYMPWISQRNRSVE